MINNVKNNILVTGGLGFIGSHFVKLLSFSGYYPVIIDKMTYAADISRLEGIENKLYTGDICNDKFVSKVVKSNDIDTIVNFAAETHVDRSIASSNQFIQSNIVGVQVLLEISRRHDLRFIQISTDEVYGSTHESMRLECQTISNYSFTETDKLSPGNPYAASKASADLLVSSYYNTYKLWVVITRSSNNYGPYQHNEKFIPRMITDALDGKPLSVYGDGENIRDWLYVEDNCLGIKLVTEKGKIGEIYNIGGNNEMTNNQVATVISNRFGVPIKYVADRPGHDRRYSIDCSKIKDELGWRPVMDFEIGLDRTIEHYRDERRLVFEE